MKITTTFVCQIAALCVVLGGCVTTPPGPDPVLTKLTELEDRLIKAERVVNNDSLVGLQAQMDQMREELRELRGLVETTQYELQEAGKRQRTQYLDVDGRLQKLEKLGVGGFVGGTNPDGGPSPAGESQAYEAAFELLKTGRYDEAKTALTGFLSSYPNSPLADNASYWLAEAHYVTAQYPAALTQFQKVITDFPSSAKVPDAMLKSGYCYYELKDYKKAREVLEAVVSTYGDSTPARLAKQRLQQIQSQGR